MSSHRPPGLRPALTGAVVAAAVVVAPLALAPPAGALATSSRGSVDHAVTWLQGRVADAPTLAATPPGALADTVLALAGTDGSRTVGVTAFTALAGRASGYVHPTSSTTDPGAAAKVVLAARAVQADPTAVGGVDADAALRGSVVAAGADAGRFGSVNLFSQSLGVLALAGGWGGAPAAPVAYLAAHQCGAGGVPLAPSCASSASGDADTTAVAAQAFAAAGRATEAGRAADWLEAHQAADGGFGPDSNANSTGLAAEALRALGRTTAADKATARVVALQKPLSDATNPGAIAATATADGDLVLATTQGLLGLGAPRLDLVRFPDVVGAPCAVGSGVTVVVDLTAFDGSVRVGCSMMDSPTAGQALRDAGFTVTDVDYGGSFGHAVCTIQGYPGGDAGCLGSEPGYWLFDEASRGGPWSPASTGVDGSHPAPGSLIGFRYDSDYNTYPSFDPNAATDWPAVAVGPVGTAFTGSPTAVPVTVTQADAPVTSGLVQVLADGAPAGPPVALDAKGQASPTATFAEPGTRQLSVRYLGDPTHNPTTSAAVAVAVARGAGYRLVASDGGIFTYGGLSFAGSEGGLALASPIVAAAGTATGEGYWLVGADGGVFNHGDAPFPGSLGATHLDAPIVTAIAAPGGKGLWLFAGDGGVFALGGAPFIGSLGGRHLDAPIVGAAPAAFGDGYYLVSSDGGVFAFGSAAFAGSMGGQPLTKPVVAMATAPTGGYRLVASDGGVFSFGGAAFLGSTGDLPLVSPIVATTAGASGYRLEAADGGVFSFGQPFLGSAGGLPLVKPIVAAVAYEPPAAA